MRIAQATVALTACLACTPSAPPANAMQLPPTTKPTASPVDNGTSEANARLEPRDIATTQAPRAEPELSLDPSLDPSPDPTHTPTLVVARPSGIVEVDFAGAVVRVLSNTPARSPRWLKEKRTLVFLGQHDGQTRDLRYLTADGATERVLTRLQLRPPCPAKRYRDDDREVPDLDVRSEEDFWVSGDATHACVLASDYAHDLRSVEQQTAVRLANGRVTKASVFGGDVCDRDDEPRVAACDRSAPPEDDVDDELESPIGGYVESRSPDGAWLLVVVGSALGDLLHINYVLVDVAGARIHPLPFKSGPWPKAMKLPQVPEDGTMMPGLPEVIAGGVVTWVGDHHLVIDQTLYVAGQSIVALGGDVAI